MLHRRGAPVPLDVPRVTFGVDITRVVTTAGPEPLLTACRMARPTAVEGPWLRLVPHLPGDETRPEAGDAQRPPVERVL